MAPRPSIKLNGIVLPPHMIAAEAQHHPSKTPAAAFQAAARAIIIRTLLLEEAARQGITGEAELVAPGKRELGDEACLRGLMEKSVPIAEPGEAECLSFYEVNTERFKSPELFEASHILLPADPKDPRARSAAVTQASALIDELRAAPQTFESLARQFSQCDSRENGGHLGQLASGETVPEFEAALYQLEVGAISPEPVLSCFGAHIIRLDARKTGATLPFTYVKDIISVFLAERSWRLRVADYIEGLIAAADIEGVDMKPARELLVA
jgi:peptidyl-prolyl cis-trans isomerase C